MNLRRALFIAAFALPSMAGPAAAQAPWPQQPATAPSPNQPPASASPWNQPPAQQQEPACAKEFFKLRDDAEMKAKAIQQASRRKASPAEACRLFNVFIAAETKMIKYAVANTASCGIPSQIVQSMKQGHAKSTEIRTKVCQAAAAPHPTGPSLSDALGGSIPDASNIKTGRGTFDTLTGTPLGNK